MSRLATRKVQVVVLELQDQEDVRVVKVVDDREFEVSGLEVPGWAEYNDNVRR